MTAAIARWWLAAAGLGLGVGLPGVVGGPLARTAVSVPAATDALGGGAVRLAHV